MKELTICKIQCLAVRSRSCNKYIIISTISVIQRAKTIELKVPSELAPRPAEESSHIVTYTELASQAKKQTQSAATSSASEEEKEEEKEGVEEFISLSELNSKRLSQEGENNAV